MRYVTNCLLAAIFFASATDALQYPFLKFKFKCSAGMVCVDEHRCDMYGVISPNVVLLPPEQEEFRMPLLPCKKKEGGTGACCRDPNYKDDWPSVAPPPTKPSTKPSTKPPIVTPRTPSTKPPIVTPRTPIIPITRSDNSTKTPSVTTPETPPVTSPTPPRPEVTDIYRTGCPTRRRNTTYHATPNAWDSGDGEFPWQSAVLDAKENFLCGCYFAKKHVCITDASCVKGRGTNDLLIAVGMYSLDRVGVQTPQIVTLERDPLIGRDGNAILFLREPIKYREFREAICYWNVWDETRPLDDCVVTGYGRDGGSLHWFDVTVSERLGTAKIDGPPGYPTNACDYIEAGHGVACRRHKDRKKPTWDDQYDFLGAVTKCSGNVVSFNFFDYQQFLNVVKDRQDRYAA